MFCVWRCYGLLWTLYCPKDRYYDVTMVWPLLFHEIRAHVTEILDNSLKTRMHSDHRISVDRFFVGFLIYEFSRMATRLQSKNNVYTEAYPDLPLFKYHAMVKKKIVSRRKNFKIHSKNLFISHATSQEYIDSRDWNPAVLICIVIWLKDTHAHTHEHTHTYHDLIIGKRVLVQTNVCNPLALVRSGCNFEKLNLQSCFTDWCIQTMPQMNATEPHWR